jgi:hypothetical protein
MARLEIPLVRNVHVTHVDVGQNVKRCWIRSSELLCASKTVDPERVTTTICVVEAVKQSDVGTLAAVGEVRVVLEMNAVERKIVRLVDALDDKLVAARLRRLGGLTMWTCGGEGESQREEKRAISGERGKK